MTKQDEIPVITVDGPGGSGKGTLSRLLAEQLGWHFLDSGAIYRVLAHGLIRHQIPFSSLPQVLALAQNLDVRFDTGSDQIYFEQQEVSLQIRTEECGAMASQVAAIAEVRTALLARQRAFKQAPGLVADGRDMGTIVFPEAPLKVFLDASVEERAKRRQNQLKAQGVDAKFEDLLATIAKRDARDRNRAVAPLVPAADAVIIDTTALSIEGVFEVVMAKVKASALASS